MPRAKRRLEVIDLTGDDTDDGYSGASRKKHSKTNTTSSFSQSRAPLPTPPGSSQIYSGPSSQGYTPAYSQPTHSQAERESWAASTQENEEDIRREIDLEVGTNLAHCPLVSLNDYSFPTNCVSSSYMLWMALADEA